MNSSYHNLQHELEYLRQMFFAFLIILYFLFFSSFFSLFCTSSMKKTLKISLQKKKKKQCTLFIGKDNASQCCVQLLNGYKADQKIKCYLNWNKLSKDVINIINVIVVNLILILSNIADILSVNKDGAYSKVQIENLDFLMHIIFLNNVIMKNWMSDPSKWKSLLVLFKVILLHEHVISPRFASLAWLITQTIEYWTMDHILFLHEIKFHKALCSAIKKAHLKNKEMQIKAIALCLTHNYFVITHRVKGDEIWFDEFKYLMDSTLYDARARTLFLKSKYPSRQRSSHRFELYRYERFVDDYRSYLYKDFEPATLMPLRFIIFKACAHYNCKKLKTSSNKIRMKICKGCKLTYYCSRKCQKRDWVAKHRNQCHRLHAKMFKK